jgi:hypothetical protein
VLAQYETDFRLRFGRRVMKVPGVSIFAFLVDQASDAGRLVERGFPAVSRENRSAYAPLMSAFVARVNSGDVGFRSLRTLRRPGASPGPA